MTAITEERLLQKMDAVESAINRINISIAEKLGETKACRVKCVASHEAVFGTGDTMGLKTKVKIIWGGIVIAWTAIVGIVVISVGRSSLFGG